MVFYVTLSLFKHDYDFCFKSSTLHFSVLQTRQVQGFWNHTLKLLNYGDLFCPFSYT